MLTKREKILLQVLGLLLLLAIVLSLLFTPAMTSYIKSGSDLVQIQEDLRNAEGIYNYPELNQRLEEEKQAAEENYNFFYAVLNSYTIDEIINKLLQKNQLKINSLDITPYEDAYTDFILAEEDIEYGEETVEEDTTRHVLLKSTITVKVEGEYNSILRFIDDLNATSRCLRVNSMDIIDATEILGENYEKYAQLRIYAYGIDLEPIGEAANIDQSAAGQTVD